MDFEKQTGKVPSSVGKLSILIDNQDDVTRVRYNVVLHDEDGKAMLEKRVSGDLKPYMTEIQIASVENFVLAIRMKMQMLVD